jgi:hypothetical protein
MSVILFAALTFGGPPVCPHCRQQRTSVRPSVCPPSEDQCLAFIL